jgi:hypothetical protein
VLSFAGITATTIEVSSGVESVDSILRRAFTKEAPLWLTHRIARELDVDEQE